MATEQTEVEVELTTTMMNSPAMHREEGFVRGGISAPIPQLSETGPIEHPVQSVKEREIPDPNHGVESLVEGPIESYGCWCMAKPVGTSEHHNRTSALGIERTLLRNRSFQSLDSYDFEIIMNKGSTRKPQNPSRHLQSSGPVEFSESDITRSLKITNHQRGESHESSTLSIYSSNNNSFSHSIGVPLNFTSVVGHSQMWDGPIDFDDQTPHTNSSPKCSTSRSSSSNLTPLENAFIKPTLSNLQCSVSTGALLVPITKLTEQLRRNSARFSLVGDLKENCLEFHCNDDIVSATFLQSEKDKNMGDQDVKIVYQLYCPTEGKQSIDHLNSRPTSCPNSRPTNLFISGSASRIYTDSYSCQKTIGRFLKTKTEFIVPFDGLCSPEFLC